MTPNIRSDQVEVIDFPQGSTKPKFSIARDEATFLSKVGSYMARKYCLSSGGGSDGLCIVLKKLVFLY